MVFHRNPTMIIADWVKKDTVVQASCGGNGGLFAFGRMRSSDVMMLSSAAGASAAGAGSFSIWYGWFYGKIYHCE